MDSSVNRFMVLLLLGAFLIQEDAYADSFTGKLTDGVIAEFFSQIAALPGLGELKQRLSKNRYQLVCLEKGCSSLEIQASDEYKSVYLIAESGARLRVNDGAFVPEGRYRLYSSSENPLLHSISRVQLVVGEIQLLELSFFPNSQEEFPLTIIRTPSHATVRLLDIVPKYFDGIVLAKGNQRVEVAIRGGSKAVKNVYLDHNQQKFYIDL